MGILFPSRFRLAALGNLCALLAGCTSAGIKDSPHDTSTPDSVPDSKPHDSKPHDSALESMPDTSSESWSSFGVLSLNLHCLKQDGTRFSSLDERLDYIAQTLVAEDIAVALIQEACRQGEVDALEGLRARLESHSGVSWGSTWVLAHVGWEGTPDESDEGVGILVRGVTQVSEPWSWTFSVQGAFTRVLAGATLPPELGAIRVHSVHLEVFDDDLDSRRRQAEAAASLALSAAGHAHVLVAGDFNDVDGSDTLQAMSDRGFIDTVSRLESNQIDHIFVHRGAAVVASDPKPIFDGQSYDLVSDHHGYRVTLSPKLPDPVALTSLTASVDVGWGHFVTVRGEGGILSWEAGESAYALPSGGWRLVLSEAGTGISYKWLKDDQGWETGDNRSSSPGESHTDTPSF